MSSRTETCTICWMIPFDFQRSMLVHRTDDHHPPPSETAICRIAKSTVQNSKPGFAHLSFTSKNQEHMMFNPSLFVVSYIPLECCLEFSFHLPVFLYFLTSCFYYEAYSRAKVAVEK
ncbi:hypothetical protein BDF20DRAFT_834098 [Mycotypha africana]|uniref:uncharacterized protein n=1 Tax=Mycotypha africana TaxID=64632 RepID=UPI002300C108|nr:uncharacterized protein BDF20DRAFT_834098 [Mycotypha africana]KAI8984605.1 hypothetical protein BDF20DRAFT_834098 [Mycotypha africana]